MRTPPVVPASPLQRAVKAVGALVLLIALVIGLPVALALLAGNPLPEQLPTGGDLWSALTSPDDGSLFLSVLTVIGWFGWAGFAGSVLLELFARLTRRPTPAVPGLRGPQRVATVLIAAIAALAVTPTVTSASAAMVGSPPAAVVMAAPIDSSGFDQVVVHQHRDTGVGSVVHLVERGEGLLDLQDRYGLPWQRIAEANYGVEQPDGRSLQRGQTRIYPGWQLQIPVSSTINESESGGAGAAIGFTTTAGFGAATDADQATGADADPVSLDNSSMDESTAAAYEVAKGDWMWHIADRYLADPERYRDIAALNPEYADRHGNFPDHIEPGWVLQLPPDAVDRGPAPHATGTTTVAEPGADESGGAETAPEPPEPESPEPPESPEQASEPSPPTAGLGAADSVPDSTTPADRSGLGTAPSATESSELAPVTDDSATGFALTTSDLERLAPAALASAGLLTALVLAAAAVHQHRRNQHHRTGFRFTSLAARRLEKALRTAQQPLDTARLDAALRQLAGALAQRPSALPDIAGALVDDGSVHLLLAEPCPQPPAPWDDHGDRWTLPAGTDLPSVTAGASRLAPLPTLAAIGSQAGIHLLLDLERLGYFTIHGDPVRSMDLLRYLAAELACNSWSDRAEVLLAGFPPSEAALLTALHPERVQVVTSIPEAVAVVRHRLTSARATLGHTGAADALAGRVRGLAGDAWMPQVLLATATSPADLAALNQLEREFGAAARCAVAVATTDAAPPHPGQRRLTITPDGMVHVRLPFLRASLAAAALSVAELTPLAETMRAARTAPQLPVPAAPEPDLWAVGTDAAGAARGVGRATVGAPSDLTPAPPKLPVNAPTLLHADSDFRLDDDLRAWRAASTIRPRIGILGPVTLDATGPAPDPHRRLHAELVVFLAQRAGQGADGQSIDTALWPELPVTDAARQLLISRVRSWLGDRPDGGWWLPDLGPDLHYRLADGYLLDWHLFRRLRTRGELRGPAGTEDLRTALQLVRGVPLAEADRPGAPGTRNPYPWLADSHIHPDHLVATIVDTAHQLAERCLTAGDPAGTRWAVQQAWLADPDRSYDQPWRDLLRAEHADGRTDQLRAVLAELMAARDAETPEDLSPDTYRLISCWPPNVLVPAN